MASNTTQMALRRWNLGTDFFSYTDLSNNWQKIDTHDHTSGKGVQIPTNGIANTAVTLAKMANNSVGTSQIVNLSVTTDKIAATAVGTTQLANASITQAKMANNSIGNAQVLNNSISPNKLVGTPAFSPGQTVVWDGSSFIGASSSGGMLYTTAAFRPTAGVTGRTHYAIDTGDVSFDNGTSWVHLYSTARIRVDAGTTIAAHPTDPRTLPLGTSLVDVSVSGMFSRVTRGTGHAIRVTQAGLYSTETVVSTSTGDKAFFTGSAGIGDAQFSTGSYGVSISNVVRLAANADVYLDLIKAVFGSTDPQAKIESMSIQRIAP